MPDATTSTGTSVLCMAVANPAMITVAGPVCALLATDLVGPYS